MRTVRLSGERGSITLLGVWLLGIFLCISMMIFILSNKECRVIVLANKSFTMQLLAESLLENQRLKLQHDMARTGEMLEQKEGMLKMLDTGERDEFTYRINYQIQKGKIIIAAVLRNKNPVKTENIFTLQWWLRVDRENGKVILEGIG
ncbi:MAG: hypothetical protein PHQ44_02240 [Anaerovibrio sp.]|nr:hypothetical protein [Anaerovibrio sp.]